MSLSIVPGAKQHEAGYLEFARANFGPDAYQASPEYLAWLYDPARPLRCADAGMLLALDSTSRIVGCIHVLTMTWRTQGNVVEVPALHNAMVAPAHRQGVGGLLIMQSFQGRACAFVPGAVDPLAAAYRRIGFVAVPTEWRAKWLHPFSAVWRRLLFRSLRRGRPVVGDGIEMPAATARQENTRSWRPTLTNDLQDIVALANRSWDLPAAFVQYWTEELFFWRFFHPLGPRHWLVTIREGARLAGYMVVSLGCRGGLAVARGVEWRAESAPAAL